VLAENVPRDGKLQFGVFDSGYVTLTPDFRIRVSKHLKEDFSNGRDYYAMEDRPLIVLPHQSQNRPGQEFIEWHNERRFRK
jgi:putative restriction endonuclease